MTCAITIIRWIVELIFFHIRAVLNIYSLISIHLSQFLYQYLQFEFFFSPLMIVLTNKLFCNLKKGWKKSLKGKDRKTVNMCICFFLLNRGELWPVSLSLVANRINEGATVVPFVGLKKKQRKSCLLLRISHTKLLLRCFLTAAFFSTSEK